MVIERSVKIRPGTYRLPASADLTRPAITIRGENITVDFNGVVLEGGPDGADPDGYAGVGILIDGGRNVTVKNAVIRGYKIGDSRAAISRSAPVAQRPVLQLEAAPLQRRREGEPRRLDVVSPERQGRVADAGRRDLPGRMRPRRSRPQHRRAGPERADDRAIVRPRRSGTTPSSSCPASVSGCTARRDSTIMHNRIDWCVRGYSHGFYNRGQDSAGLLMYEQSSRNTVAYNSITHGGDGLFLWAGQSTMDTGQGGSNDNRFFANDFSHAVTNGIEATFSRNSFYRQPHRRLLARRLGRLQLRLGLERQPVRAATPKAIAIEHGQDIRIEGNTFDGDETAIRLWQNPRRIPTGDIRSCATRGAAATAARQPVRGQQDRARHSRDDRASTRRRNTFDGVGVRVWPVMPTSALDVGRRRPSIGDD